MRSRLLEFSYALFCIQRTDFLFYSYIIIIMQWILVGIVKVNEP